VNATNPSLEPDLSGQVFDRYRLVRLLGIGGMGAVYEAEHIALEKRVAVKMLRQQFTMQPIARKRFLREAKAATRVKHPNVVDISDFGETADGRVYFVMELLVGRDLREVLEAEPQLSWPRVQKILIQTASALEAAHTTGIVHRDMKPSNCFVVDAPGLEDQDFIKVLDFGIAKFAGGSVGEETQGLTSTDEIFGTVGYMAPEMAIGTTNDIRSDIYALGVMMYRMLVGDLPFTGNTAFQILAKHVNESPPRPRDKVPSIPVGVEAIILKALAKSPDARFPSMKVFRDALRQGGLEDTPPTGPTGPTVQALPLGSSKPPRTEAEELLARPTGAPPVEATQHLSSSVAAKPSPRPGLKPPPIARPVPPPPGSRPVSTDKRVITPAPPQAARAPARQAPGAPVEGATVIAKPIAVGPAKAPPAVAKRATPSSTGTSKPPPPPEVGAPMLEEEATTVSAPLDISAPWASEAKAPAPAKQAVQATQALQATHVRQAVQATHNGGASIGSASSVGGAAAPAAMGVQPGPSHSSAAMGVQPGPSHSSPAMGVQPAPPPSSAASTSGHVPSSAASVSGGYIPFSSSASMSAEQVDSSSAWDDTDAPPRSRFRAAAALSLVGVVAFGAMLWLGLTLNDSPSDASVAAGPTEPPSPKPDPAPEKAASVPAEPAPERALEDDVPATPPPEPRVPVEPLPSSDPTNNPEGEPEPAEPEPAEPEPAEPEPAEPEPAEPEPKQLKASKPKPKEPKTDEEAAKLLASKLKSRCKAGGTTNVKIEGAISTDRSVLSPMVQPSGDYADCIRKVVKGYKFPAGKMRRMPTINVKL
jgi:serine/threonine protein kinase/outer membrane biosynthesis protein TonB